jgi:Ras-related GTP-binding protein C/D
MQSYEICSDYIDVIVDVSEIYGQCFLSPGVKIGAANITQFSYDRKPQGQTASPTSESASDAQEESSLEASSIIRLQNGMVLYLREINKSLSLLLLFLVELSSVHLTRKLAG